MRKPNIILMNCDDLGYGDLGCYGSPCNRTPHIDALAAEGMRMTDFYMVSPVCSPSRGGMLTGCQPNRIGFDDFEGHGVLFPGMRVGLRPGENTIASLLRKEGYATMLVGKWHCGDQPDFLPTRHGFDRYFGLPYSNDMGRQVGDRRAWVERLQRDAGCNYAGNDAAELDTDYPPLPLLDGERILQEQPDQAALTERYVAEAVRFLEEKRDEPFFLYFAHMYVHLPIYVPEPFLQRSQNGRYGAAVEHIDWTVAVLRAALRRLGLEKDTLFIFTSDNGSRARGEGGSNAPLRGTKMTTWEGGQRVPCIIHWPGVVPAGATSQTLAAAYDFLPTLLEFAGGEVPATPTIDGKSLAAVWRGETAASPHTVFAYYHRGTLQAIRNDRWKLHVCKGDGGEEVCGDLYDLRADPGETQDLQAAHPDVVAALTAEADRLREVLGDRRLGIPGTERRPIGRVASGGTLTHFSPDHPYFAVEYDLGDAG